MPLIKIEYILFVIALILFLAVYVKDSLYYTHMMQQNSYMLARYVRWMKQHKNKVFKFRYVLPGLYTIIFLFDIRWLWVLALLIVSYGFALLQRDPLKVKKKLVYTARVKRILSVHFGLFLVITAVMVLIVVNWLSVMIYMALVSLLTPFTILVSIALLKPVENRIGQYYSNDAKSIIEQLPDLKVIGITGSYGKTSTKHIVEKILSRSFQVVMTPGSYNTTLGNVITIRKELNTMTDVYIAEMGAKQTGDIEEICDLVKPDIGILTSIGPQHLETFKTLDNVIKTKFELIDSLKPGGLAVLNDDNVYIKDNQTKHIGDGVKTLSYGLNNGKNIIAKSIKISGRGMSFETEYQGETYQFETRLLGTHNINNLLAGIVIAFELGMTYKNIYMGVKEIAAVNHRLELSQKGNFTLIDDAYNANPEGAKMALEVLDVIEGNKKIIITPGMIELGDLQYEANHNFGKQITEVCDYVILEGKKQSEPIYVGLKAMDFPEEKIAIVSDIYEAYAVLNKMVEAGDVVLIENDLPDNYNE